MVVQWFVYSPIVSVKPHMNSSHIVFVPNFGVKDSSKRYSSVERQSSLSVCGSNHLVHRRLQYLLLRVVQYRVLGLNALARSE